MTRIFPAPSGYLGQLVVIATIERGYFSVTAEIGTARQRGRGEGQAYGCLHEHCVIAMPELLPLIDLHLSDSETGEPMHAEANGWYWLAGAHGGLKEQYHGGNEPRVQRTKDQCLEILANHVRLPFEQVSKELIDVTTRDAWKLWVEKQKARWEHEAAKGRRLLKKLEGGK